MPVSEDSPKAPNPAFVAQLQELRRIANDSKILDSRVEIWSFRMGVDPNTRRSWLRQGYAVRFTVLEGQHLVSHTVFPKEVR